MTTRIAGWLTAVVMAAAASASAQTKPYSLPPAPPAIAQLTLPSGPLKMFAAGPQSVVFMDDARPFKREGSGAVGILYFVYRDGIRSEGRIVTQVVQRERIDCDRRTHQSLGDQGFDAGDRFVIWAYDVQAHPDSEGPLWQMLSDYVCQRAVLLQPLQAFATRAEAMPAAEGYMRSRN